MTNDEILIASDLLKSWGEVYEKVKLVAPAMRAAWSCRVEDSSDVLYRAVGGTWVEAVLNCEKRMALVREAMSQGGN